MTFKALLYKYYARRGPIGVESKEQGGLENLGPLALRSNNKYSNKIVAETIQDMYNNEQVSKVFYSEFQLKHA